jgi:hypothetical protein
VDIGDKKAAEKTSQALREKPTDEVGTVVPASIGGTLLPDPASYLAGTILPEVTPNVTIVTGAATTKIEEEEDKPEEKEQEKDLFSAAV